MTAVAKMLDRADSTGRLACIVRLVELLGCDVEAIRTLRWANVILPERSPVGPPFGVTHRQLHVGMCVRGAAESDLACMPCLAFGAIAWPDPAAKARDLLVPLGPLGLGAIDRYLRRREASRLPADSVWLFPDIVRGGMPMSRATVARLLRRAGQLAGGGEARRSPGNDQQPGTRRDALDRPRPPG